MLLLKAHLEGVLSINLGEIVSDLNCRADLVRRQEGAATQTRQSAYTYTRQTAILFLLRNPSDPELSSPTIAQCRAIPVACQKE